MKRKNEISDISAKIVALIVITALLIFGIWILKSSGISKIKNFDSLIEYIKNAGIEIYFGIFFVICGALAWYNSICEIIIKPTHKVLYLKKALYSSNRLIHKYIFLFLDKRGKKYEYDTDIKLEENEFYDVIKRRKEIKEVIGISDKTYKIPVEKISYWLNFYTPLGNFEEILVLPIAYLFFIPSLLSFILSQGKYRLYGGILMILPLLFIVYDLIYKLKLKKASMNGKIKNVENEMESFRNIIENVMYKLPYVIATIFLVGIDIFLIKTFFDLDLLMHKAIITPFILCVLIATLQCIFLLLEKHGIVSFLTRIYAIVFLLLWFGFLGFTTFHVIKQGQYTFALFTLPFWIIGFFIFYNKVLKK